MVTGKKQPTLAEASSEQKQANKGHVYSASPEEMSAILGSRGRKRLPSLYEDEVRNAEPGEVYLVKLSTLVTAGPTAAQLRKAGKDLGLKVRIYDRQEQGFVAFQVVPPDAAE